MKPEMQAAFAPLQQRLQAKEYTDVDLLELIGEFAGHDPRVAQALAFHARDILVEHDQASQEVQYSCVLVEVYRRTFFDEETAKKYGTEHIPEKGPEELQALSTFLIHSLDADDMVASAGCFTPSSTETH